MQTGIHRFDHATFPNFNVTVIGWKGVGVEAHRTRRQRQIGRTSCAGLRRDLWRREGSIDQMLVRAQPSLHAPGNSTMPTAAQPKAGPLPLRSRVCVIVSGVHRSGTSATTRVVNLLGADIAHELIPPRPDNIRGYWEWEEVVKIHRDLLRAVGSSSEDPLPLPAGWAETSATRQAKRQLSELIAREFGNSRIFVVKDPRLSKLLPLWLELLDALDIDPVVIIPFRNPLEVAASLSERDRLSKSESMLLYAHGYLGTELASRAVPRCFVRYNKLVSEWQVMLASLNKVLRSHPLAASPHRSAEIDRFLTLDLYHHRRSRHDLANDPDIPGTVVEMFDRMSDAADTSYQTRLRCESHSTVSVRPSTKPQGYIEALSFPNAPSVLVLRPALAGDGQRRSDG
jgi:hypothetical protein